MFNTELCKIYTPEVIDSLKNVAAKLEKQDRHAIVCFPHEHRGMVVPETVFIEGDCMDMHDDLVRVTYDNVAVEILMREEYPTPSPSFMDLYQERYGGTPLWV